MTGDRFNGIVQFLKESFYRNKLCKNKDKQPVLYHPGVAHMLASRAPIKAPLDSVLSGVLSRSQKMFSLLLLPSAALAWAPAPGLVLSSVSFQSEEKMFHPLNTSHFTPAPGLVFVYYFLFQSEEKLIDPFNTSHFTPAPGLVLSNISFSI